RRRWGTAGAATARSSTACAGRARAVGGWAALSETFKYRASDQAGKISTGTITADSRELVVNVLREQGFVPLAVDLQRQGVKREIRLRNKVKIRDLSQTSRQLSTLINSGV